MVSRVVAHAGLRARDDDVLVADRGSVHAAERGERVLEELRVVPLDVVEALAKKRILAGVPVSRLLPGDASLANLLLVAATETNTDQDMDALAGALREDL